MNPDVVEDVAAFLGISAEELLERHDNYLQYQLARWHRLSPLDATALADFYNDNLYLYELISAPRFGIVRLIEPFLRPESAILDYGSGIGTHGLHFLGRGHQVTFVDLPSPHFDYIRWHTSRANLPAKFVETPAAKALPENAFDAVFCFDVLEHVLDWRETIQHFSRLLKSEGRLFLIVSLLEFEEHAIHISSQTGLTEDSFRECMEQNGFVEIFHRDRPVPLSHPQEPFKVFARTADESVSRISKLFETGEAHRRAGSIVDAERCFAEIAAWNPQDFSAHRALARIFLSQEKLIEAAAEVGATLELLPDDVEALELSADIHMKSGNRLDAGRRYAEAIAIRSEQAGHSKRMLARLLREGESFGLLCGHIEGWRKLLALLGYLIEIGSFAEAEALAGRLTAAHPPKTYAGYLVWKEYARLLREEKRSAEAIEVLESLISDHPDRPWLHFDISLCHSLMGSYAAALAELDKEEALSPFRFAILFERGIVWRRQGDLVKAIALFTEAAELAPENGAVFFERGRAALLLGDPGAALADLTQATALMPENGAALFERGRAALLLGDRAAAIVLLRQAAALMPDNAQAHLELGRLEQSLKHFRKAIVSFDNVYRLAPDELRLRWVIVIKLVRAARGVMSRIRR